jgi:hypothetical protein
MVFRGEVNMTVYEKEVNLPPVVAVIFVCSLVIRVGPYLTGNYFFKAALS